MRVATLSARDFRCYRAADVALCESVTVVHGCNGAGKTNLLEALFYGCTGHSCRTGNDREVVRFGAQTARVELTGTGDDGPHQLSAGVTPGEAKHLRVDGVRVDRMLDSPVRPLVSVFLPDRLELVKGTPALRRAHLDRFVAALWPSRAETRRAYGRALAQRNALLSRIRAGTAGSASLDAWDAELARHGIVLMEDRADAVGRLQRPFAARADDLGLDGGPAVAYRPRSKATTEPELLAELAGRRDSDLERGHSGHGPHRDELVLKRDGRELRVYGSQGQQRLALLALLLAEREVLAEERGNRPLMLLDDVMSELDPERRRRLMEILAQGGQSFITTTDLALVPSIEGLTYARVAVAGGHVLGQADAGAAPAAAGTEEAA